MWAIRAYVIARKGVLVNSPEVQSMSVAQWAFEYLALKKMEKEAFEANFKALRMVLVSTMGLNALRPEDDKGKPKSPENMTEDERDAFLPLVAWIGRPELLKAVKEQIEHDLNFEKDPQSDDEYERLVAAIDANDGDMDPILGLPKSEYRPVPPGMRVDPMYKESLKDLVKEYPGKSKGLESIVDIDGDV